ncbi:hypothetical protein C0993_000800 [Termitomyces sp. T159_Od127]|nr:hypothetical protein C0993_000800 [Termitomyces sp. T159_Od127]
MSSSRRSSSSRSTSTIRSRTPPVWRTVTISKNSPARTGLSYVFAEPEHGAPLASAKSNLPVIKTFSLDELDSEENEEQTVAAMVGRRSDEIERATSQEDVSSLADPTISVTDERDVASREDLSSLSHEAPQISLSTESAPVAPSINITASTPTMSASEPIPFSLPDTPTPSPRKASWFGSLSRARGRAKADQLHQPTVASVVCTSVKEAAAEQNPPPPTVTVVNPPATPPIDAATMPLPPSQPPTPIPSPPRAVPRQPASKRSWFSSPTPERTSSVPSSIDEETPAIPVFTPLSSSPTSIATHAIVTSPSNDSNTGRPRLSSLNPSTSRFALSIPLLGRPKIPIDQVPKDVSDPNPTSESLPDPTETNPTPQTASAPISLPEIAVVTPDPTPVADSQPVTEEDNTIQSSTAISTIQTSSSWWSYVGWSSSPTVTVSAPAESAQPPSRDPSPTPTVRGPTPPPPTESDSDSNVDLVAGDDSVQSSPESPDLTTTPRPHSGDAAGDVLPASSSSSWYNPWAWYPSASTSTLVPTPVTPVSTATETTSAATEKSESETITGPVLTGTVTNEIKDAASAPTEETSKDSGLEQSPRSLNPVEATITMNRSGWASFFSSRSLIVKTITAPPARDVERDENGMEVMDVPDDEPQQHPQAPSRLHQIHACKHVRTLLESRSQREETALALAIRQV